MITITREQLIEDLKASTQNARGMFEIGEETICALMQTLTAEPVAWTSQRGIDDVFLGEVSLIGRNGAIGDVPLYTAPIAPIEMPSFDEWLTSTGRKPVAWVREVMEESYNACRAAMLERQSVDHVEQVSVPTIQTAPALDSVAKNAESMPSNSPVIPDGCL